MISFLKGGIVFADAVTTVSPTYAREIQTPEYGFGFDGLLRSRGYKLRGILNGVDYVGMESGNRPLSPGHFSCRRSGQAKPNASGHYLQEMGLPSIWTGPLIGIVSRFADQKGFDLVAEIAESSRGTGCAAGRAGFRR